MREKQKKAVTIALFIFALSLFFLFLWWFLYAQFRQSTQDAYVQGNLVELTPLVPGIVTAIHTDETEQVMQGKVLVELDKTDYEIALEKAMSELASTVRQVSSLFEKAKQLQKELEAQEAVLLRAYVDYKDRKDLTGTGAVSEEDIIHAQTAMLRAQASYLAKKHAYFSQLAKVENTEVATHPKVLLAKEKVKQAYVNLRRCDLFAPATGIVAMRSVQVGQHVDPNSALLSIIPLEQVWVDANYKETELKKVRPGQRVTLKADLYGSSIIFEGTVMGINGGTGAIFSILPPQNATGNWIKIVQRVPVRIALDPKQISKYPLFPGLSMKVTIHTDSVGGDFSLASKQARSEYRTIVFEEEEGGVSDLIEQIIKKNLFIEPEDGEVSWFE